MLYNLVCNPRVDVFGFFALVSFVRFLSYKHLIFSSIFFCPDQNFLAKKILTKKEKMFQKKTLKIVCYKKSDVKKSLVNLKTFTSDIKALTEKDNAYLCLEIHGYLLKEEVELLIEVLKNENCQVTKCFFVGVNFFFNENGKVLDYSILFVRAINKSKVANLTLSFSGLTDKGIINMLSEFNSNFTYLNFDNNNFTSGLFLYLSIILDSPVFKNLQGLSFVRNWYAKNEDSKSYYKTQSLLFHYFFYLFDLGQYAKIQKIKYAVLFSKDGNKIYKVDEMDINSYDLMNELNTQTFLRTSKNRCFFTFRFSEKKDEQCNLLV